jgi:hypothetical protein
VSATGQDVKWFTAMCFYEIPMTQPMMAEKGKYFYDE